MTNTPLIINFEVMASEPVEASCCRCKTKVGPKVVRYCQCYYHPECLKRFIESSQKDRCPMCMKQFENVLIIRESRPFHQFMLTTAMCTSAAIFVIFFLYCLQFFLIVGTLYKVSINRTAYIIRMMILIPGILYIIFFVLSKCVVCYIVRAEYLFWTEQNYRLRVVST